MCVLGNEDGHETDTDADMDTGANTKVWSVEQSLLFLLLELMYHSYFYTALFHIYEYIEVSLRELDTTNP